MTDLFSVLDPPSEDARRLVGTLRGSLEGLGAGIECWCGVEFGWLALGEVVVGGGQASVLRHRGRLMVVLAFDLAATKTPEEATNAA